MKITYTQVEMYTILRSLDFYSRIWIGQYNEIQSDLRWHRDCRLLDDLAYEIKYRLQKIRHLLLPKIDNLGYYGSYGIFSDEIDYRAGVAYNMQQVFRYTLAYYLHPEGGITVDFNEPLRAELDPYEFPRARCYKENNQVIIEIEINKEQLHIIKTALQVQQAKYEGNIELLFSYYTDNINVLKLGQELNNILKEIPEQYPIKENFEKIIQTTEDYLNKI